jgi:hypothetical protein
MPGDLDEWSSYREAELRGVVRDCVERLCRFDRPTPPHPAQER